MCVYLFCLQSLTICSCGLYCIHPGLHWFCYSGHASFGLFPSLLQRTPSSIPHLCLLSTLCVYCCFNMCSVLTLHLRNFLLWMVWVRSATIPRLLAARVLYLFWRWTIQYCMSKYVLKYVFICMAKSLALSLFIPCIYIYTFTYMYVQSQTSTRCIFNS